MATLSNTLKTLAVAAVVGIATIAPATAQSVDKITTKEVFAVLDELGLSYTVERDFEDMPRVNVNTAALPAEQMSISFYDCDANDQCEDIMIWSWYTGKPSMETVNAWNEENRFTRAYIDEDQDAVLETDINATGGIGTDAIGILMRTYFEASKNFAVHIQQ